MLKSTTEGYPQTCEETPLCKETFAECQKTYLNFNRQMVITDYFFLCDIENELKKC